MVYSSEYTFSDCLKFNTTSALLGISFTNRCLSLYLTRSHYSCYRTHDRGTVPGIKVLYSIVFLTCFNFPRKKSKNSCRFFFLISNIRHLSMILV